MTDKTGGPAFPSAIAVGATGDVYHGHDGMTLRDLFAFGAMMTLIPMHKGCEFKDVARKAWGTADAMLDAREMSGDAQTDMVLVPIEATREMMDCGVDAAKSSPPHYSGIVGHVQIRSAWDAMIALARQKESQ